MEFKLILKTKLRDEINSLDKMTHNAGKQIGEFASDFASQATDYWKTSTDYVKENPAKGIAIAAAAGVVAGGLLTVLMSRRH